MIYSTFTGIKYNEIVLLEWENEEEYLNFNTFIRYFTNPWILPTLNLNANKTFFFNLIKLYNLRKKRFILPEFALNISKIFYYFFNDNKNKTVLFDIFVDLFDNDENENENQNNVNVNVNVDIDSVVKKILFEKKSKFYLFLSEYKKVTDVNLYLYCFFKYLENRAVFDIIDSNFNRLYNLPYKYYQINLLHFVKNDLDKMELILIFNFIELKLKKILNLISINSHKKFVNEISKNYNELFYNKDIYSLNSLDDFEISLKQKLYSIEMQKKLKNNLYYEYEDNFIQNCVLFLTQIEKLRLNLEKLNVFSGKISLKNKLLLLFKKIL